MSYVLLYFKKKKLKLTYGLEVVLLLYSLLRVFFLDGLRSTPMVHLLRMLDIHILARDSIVLALYLFPFQSNFYF